MNQRVGPPSSSGSSKGRVSGELLQKIREGVNIVEVIGEHVVLRKSGANFTGLCPFHSERSPSFSVSENKQLYHCYGCKKGGDLFSFVMEMHGLSFPEAVEDLAERAKIALPKDWGGQGASPEMDAKRAAQRDKIALAQKLNRFAAAFFHHQLDKAPHIANYFKERGIRDLDLIRSFYLGAAPASWDALSQHLTAKKAPLPLAVELGLIRPSTRQVQSGAGYFDLFRNRAMFPILDMRGKVAGFGGRTVPLPKGAPDVGGADQPKYLNSPESLLFHKNKLLYGLFQAQKHVREKDEVILVEGYYDVLALHAAGFQNAVATCGTALTQDHITLLKRFCSKIILLFDGDKAGIAATERSMELGLENGQVFYGTLIPGGQDPDEVLFADGLPRPEGRAEMQQILAQAKPLLDDRIEQELAKADQGPEARTQAIKTISRWLAKFKDPVGREVRLETLQNRLGMSREFLMKTMNSSGGQVGGPAPSAPRRQPAPQSAPPRPKNQRKSGISPRERLLLQALAKGGEYLPYFQSARDKLPPGSSIRSFFDHGPSADWAELRMSEGGAPGDIFENLEDPQLRSIITEALVSERVEGEREDVKVAIDRSLGKTWAQFSQQIKSALAAAEAKKDAGLQAKLMKEYLDVQRKMKEFVSFYDEA